MRTCCITAFPYYALRRCFAVYITTAVSTQGTVTHMLNRQS